MSEAIDFGRAICSDQAGSERREWLVTNGLGGFASGTAGGLTTRRYHGLLVAALAPPGGRRLLVTRLDETVQSAGTTYPLFANRWSDGTLEPEGERFLERFRLEGSVPVWTFALAGALVEKRVWMEDGLDATYVRYTAVRARGSLRFAIKALVNDRDVHANTHAGDWHMDVAALSDGIRVTAFAGAQPFAIRAAGVTFEPAHEWYRNYELARERERGLDDLDDNLHAANLRFELAQGESRTIVLSVDGSSAAPGSDSPDADPLERRRARDTGLLRTWSAARPEVAARAPGWYAQLVLAADQFVVRRASSGPEGEGGGRSVIAGYHWFGDWGRDTAIALPGLTLATGRFEIAREILGTFARFIDGGMLPNTIPAPGERVAYNTVDAALWYIEAVHAYLDATGDRRFVAELYPALRSIVDGYTAGTRFGIHEDPADGLIAAGETGVQLTWMDAKVDGRVITPRIGKPVEIAALWHNALTSLAHVAELCGARDDAARFAAKAAHTANGFARFWNAERGYLYDVLDGPQGNDAALRPNQLFALSLRVRALSETEGRAVVAACGRELVTTYGLRSLAPSDPQYAGYYGGPQAQRDGAYHQGTVWGWLGGPFALAHSRAYGDRSAAATFVEALGRQLDAYGVGTLPEIADGDAPHTPRGCIAQAWTVAEVLRVWPLLTESSP